MLRSMNLMNINHTMDFIITNGLLHPIWIQAFATVWRTRVFLVFQKTVKNLVLTLFSRVYPCPSGEILKVSDSIPNWYINLIFTWTKWSNDDT